MGGPNHTITTPHCLECLKELEEGVVCSECGWPGCNAECSAGPNHQIECKVLTANREKIDQEPMKERNALYWPISALRVLLKAKNNPEDWQWYRRCLDIARSTQRRRPGTFTRDSLSTLFEI